MFTTLPDNVKVIRDWKWEQYDPYFQALTGLELEAANVDQWLRDWTSLNDLVSELYARLSVAVTVDTTDKDAEASYNAFLDQILIPAQAADQKLKQKLLASGLEPENFVVPLRRMRTEAALFRESNLLLLSEERKMASEYNKIIGAQTVHWEGNEVTLQQLRLAFESPDRAKREQAWRLAAERQLSDRDAINQLWTRFFDLRQRLAANAELANYREFRWQQMLRLDYSPQDCREFQLAIEQAVVPAATRMYEKYRNKLGLSSLRPWDLDLDLYPLEFPTLPTYGSVFDLQAKAGSIFLSLDQQLGSYFKEMRTQGLLDLENRKGKAPGAYCTGFPVARQPFIFMNAIGVAGDIRTIIHESGHAFHNYERLRLPYYQQRAPGLEFAEVASMAMELLTFPYIDLAYGGFYSDVDSHRFRISHLERILAFWPYMAVVDAFQHWVYTHPEAAGDTANCDAAWFELWQRYLPGVDWSGLSVEAMTGWHRKQHIFRYPFYYIEYGVAQLGAVQVWNNALLDPDEALQQYRYALSLGGTVTLPDLYRAAGAKLAFDFESLSQAVRLIEKTIVEYETDVV